MNTSDSYLAKEIKEIEAEMGDLVPLVMTDGRLTHPSGEKPSLVDLALEAIRRGFQGAVATELIRHLADQRNLESPDAGEAFEAFYASTCKYVIGASCAVIRESQQPDLNAELLIKGQEFDEGLRRFYPTW